MIIKTPFLLDHTFINANSAIIKSKRDRDKAYNTTDLLTRYNNLTYVTECIRRSHRTAQNLHKVILAILPNSHNPISPVIGHLTTFTKVLNYSYFFNNIINWYYDKNAKWQETAMTICCIAYEVFNTLLIIASWHVLPFTLSTSLLSSLKFASDCSTVVFYKWTQVLKRSEKEAAIQKTSQTLLNMNHFQIAEKKVEVHPELQQHFEKIDNSIRAQELKLECLNLEKGKLDISNRWLNMILVAKTIEIATPILAKIGLAYVSGVPLLILGFAISAYGTYKKFYDTPVHDGVEDRMDRAYTLVTSPT